MSQDLQLMYLMCSRFCHDLAAPLGAVSIGLEMLDIPEEPDNPQSILKHSIQSAMNKLELMRCLCGYATYPDRPTLDDACRVVDKSVDPHKYKINWNATIDDKINGDPVRLFLALIILCLEAMPRGGEITLNRDYSLTVTGPFVKFNDATMDAINGRFELHQLDSRAIIGHFVKLLADRLKTKVVFSFAQPNHVHISFQ